MKENHIRKFIYLSIVAAIVTIVLKFYAYLVSGSIGLLSDALESFVNLLAAVFALMMYNISLKPADKKHEFGHSKAEYFSSAAEGGLILVAAFTIVWSAVPRLLDPQPIDNINVGLLFSFLASLVNLIVGLILIRVGKKNNSILLEADGKHLMTDVWSSVAVIGAIVLVKYTGWMILDPIIAILVGFNIIYTGYRLLMRSASGLMDASLPNEDLKMIVSYLDSLKFQEIEYHSLRTRAAGRRRFISMHVLVPGKWTVKQAHDHADEIEETIVKMFNDPVTVHTHLEPVEDPASMKDIGIDRS